MLAGTLTDPIPGTLACEVADALKALRKELDAAKDERDSLLSTERFNLLKIGELQDAQLAAEAARQLAEQRCAELERARVEAVTRELQTVAEADRLRAEVADLRAERDEARAHLHEARALAAQLHQRRDRWRERHEAAVYVSDFIQAQRDEARAEVERLRQQLRQARVVAPIGATAGGGGGVGGPGPHDGGAVVVVGAGGGGAGRPLPAGLCAGVAGRPLEAKATPGVEAKRHEGLRAVPLTADRVGDAIGQVFLGMGYVQVDGKTHRFTPPVRSATEQRGMYPEERPQFDPSLGAAVPAPRTERELLAAILDALKDLRKSAGGIRADLRRQREARS